MVAHYIASMQVINLSIGLVPEETLLSRICIPEPLSPGFLPGKQVVLQLRIANLEIGLRY
jgi:hypothetical protein